MDEAKKTRAGRDLAAIRKQLVDRRNEIEVELRQLYEEKFSDDQVQDVADQALSSTMESLKSSLQGTKLDEYKRISLAIEMIDDGTYGKCVDCHSDISEKRLKLFPNATRCLACQEIFEEQGSAEKFE